MSKKGHQQPLVFDLDRYLNKQVHVKFTGGREVRGILKGHDATTNLVLDDAEEFFRDPNDDAKISSETRKLGWIVCIGRSVMLMNPTNQMIELTEDQVKEQMAMNSSV